MDNEYLDYEEYEDWQENDENLPSTINSEENLPTSYDKGYRMVEKVMQSTDNILSVARDIKQMNVAMHQMDVNFNSFVAQLEYNLQKFQGNAPIVREQLNHINNRMDRLMDKIMEMDPKTDREYDEKLRMLDSLDNYSDKISSLMIKLLES